MRLYLIRHGETAWSLSGQHTGRTDIPLTARGEAMAAGLAPYLATLPIRRVFTSPRGRARRTCALAGLDQALITDDLAEWDYGDYEGQTSAAIHQTRPDWEIFRDGCPHGETPQEVSTRADRLITHLLDGTGDVALFSHGHFSRVLAARWIGMDLPSAAHWTIDPASIGVLRLLPDHAPVRMLERWNQVNPCA